MKKIVHGKIWLSCNVLIIFVGPPGVGKTHLAVGIGIKAAIKRKRVLFFNAEELITELDLLQ